MTRQSTPNLSSILDLAIHQLVCLEHGIGKSQDMNKKRQVCYFRKAMKNC